MTTSPDITEVDVFDGYAEHDVLTSVELAAACRVSKLTVYQWVRSGGLPARYLGAAGFRFNVGRTRDWLESTGRAKSARRRAAALSRQRDENGRFIPA